MPSIHRAILVTMELGQKLLFFVCFLWISFIGRAQQIQIQLGPDEISENQAWTISISVINDQLKSYGNFPDINGFKKRGTSTQSQTNIINGQVTSSQSVLMTYTPAQQGIITVPPFSIKINDQSVNSPGKKVKVGPPVQVQTRDPFRSLFDGRDSFGKTEAEFVDVKEDALLALTTSKEEVFVGEGFTATLSFLVADNNRAPMQFHDLGRQLSEILKKLKPSNCWEENFNIENIEGESVNIQGKGYTRYKIYQAAFYPLNLESVIFPGVGLEMIKFKVAKNPSFFGQNRQEDFKTFHSSPKAVRVKELPPHPLQNSVAVGNYQLSEEIATTELQTGQSIAYAFNIYGEGNISAIERPKIPKDRNFDFYEPNVQQNVKRENGRVSGTKSFRYFLIPKEPGHYDMGKYYSWVFFHSSKNKYDTLRSRVTLHVQGESQRNQAIQSTDLGSFYDRIEITENTLHSTANQGWIKMGVNIFILCILASSAFLVFRKKS